MRRRVRTTVPIEDLPSNLLAKVLRRVDADHLEIEIRLHTGHELAAVRIYVVPNDAIAGEPLFPGVGDPLGRGERAILRDLDATEALIDATRFLVGSDR